MVETYWERKLWEPDIEAMPRKELRELQKKKLFPELIYAYENAPFYHELYDKEKIDVYKIRTIEDFQEYVPTVNKDTLRSYRERTGDIFCGNRCLPLTVGNFDKSGAYSGADLLHSTGTTGMPTYYVETKDDVETYGNLCARSWWRALLRPGDIAFCGDEIDALLSWHFEEQMRVYGRKKIKAFLVMYDSLNAVPGFNTAMQLEAQGIHIRWIDTVNDVGYLWLVRKMEQEDKNLKRDYFPELKAVVITNILSKALIDYGSELFGVPVVNTGAVSETMLTFAACAYDWKEGGGGRANMHFPEDTHFVEILPPRSDKTVEGAEFGELVITNLFSQGMAYIRFRSDDYIGVRYDPCPYCGYTHMQAWGRGRVPHSVDVKGKIIPMGDVEDILYAHPECRPLPIQMIREEPQPQDKLRLRVAYKTDLVKEPEQYRLKLVDELKKGLGVDTEIDLLTAEEMEAAAVGLKYARVIKEKRQS